MQDRYGEKVYSTRELAKKYSNNHMYYQRKLELLELPETVNTCLQNGKINETHCRHICKLLNRDKLQKKFEELFVIKFNDWDKNR